MNWTRPAPVTVTCFRGLAPYLQEELEALGFPIVSSGEIGIETRATLAECMRLNLELRTAINVLYQLSAFRCRTAEDLYFNVNKMPWEAWIDPGEYLTVVSSVETPEIDNSMFPNLRVKDAVVDRLQANCGARPDSGPDRTGMVLHLWWKGIEAKLSINTSGKKIADRGYRRHPHAAPLREPLAAAILLECGYKGDIPLVLPMCGSGTLAIEAALMARNRAPGLLRDEFGFMHIRDFPDADYKEMRGKISRRRASGPPAPIIASDHDAEAIEAARRNAMTAGAEHLIEFHECDFAETPVPEGPGIVILNPPYGERMGETAELEATYRRTGDFFKQRCADYMACIFTGNPRLAKKVGLRAKRRVPFWNAKIECRLLKYDIYAGSRD